MLPLVLIFSSDESIASASPPNMLCLVEAVPYLNSYIPGKGVGHPSGRWGKGQAWDYFTSQRGSHLSHCTVPPLLQLPDKEALKLRVLSLFCGMLPGARPGGPWSCCHPKQPLVVMPSKIAEQRLQVPPILATCSSPYI